MIKSIIKPVTLAAALSASLSACSSMPMASHAQPRKVAAVAAHKALRVMQEPTVVQAKSFSAFARQAITLYQYPIHVQYLDFVCAQRRPGGAMMVLTLPNRARGLAQDGAQGHYQQLPVAGSCKELVGAVKARFRAGQWWMPGFVQL